MPYIGAHVRSKHGRFNVSILDDSGTALPLFDHPRDGSIWLVGKEGLVYQIEVLNLGNESIEVITTVDGLNTLKNENGDTIRNKGRSVAAGMRYTARGWRTDNRSVRQFKFGSVDHSLAMQVSDQPEIGVIGIAAHSPQLESYYLQRPVGPRQHFAPHSHYDEISGETLKSAPTIATGMGDLIEDPIEDDQPFQRDGCPPDVMEIFYDTEEVLRRQGVLDRRRPKAFPGLPTGYGGYRPAG